MNDLNLLHYSFMPWKYITNWPKNIKYFFRVLKWSWQRITRGFSDYDTYDLDHFYTSLMRDSLRHLANTANGFPDGFTYEEWQEWLRETAMLLDKSVDREFEDFQFYKNPYEDKYSEYLKELNFDKERTPAEEELVQNYLNEEILIYKKRVEDRNAALDRLKEKWDNLWD